MQPVTAIETRRGKLGMTGAAPAGEGELNRLELVSHGACSIT